MLLIQVLCGVAFFTSIYVFKTKWDAGDLRMYISLLIITFFALLGSELLDNNEVKLCFFIYKEYKYPYAIENGIYQNNSVFEIKLVKKSLSSSNSFTDFDTKNHTEIGFVHCPHSEYRTDCARRIKNLKHDSYYCIETNLRNNNYGHNIDLIYKPDFNPIRNRTEIFNNEYKKDCAFIFAFLFMIIFILKYALRFNVDFGVSVDTETFSFKKKKMPENKAKKFSAENRECAICLNTIKIDKLYTPINCFCFFHDECLDRIVNVSMAVNHVCPVCKQ